MATDTNEEKPPEAPALRRSIRLYPYQWVTLPLLIAIPIAALAGAFGERNKEWSVSHADLEMRLQVPRVMRYGQLAPLRLSITNHSSRRLDSLSVEFDRNYISRFVRVQFVPAFLEPYVLQFSRVNPGETAHVRVELQASEYGRHRGTLRVRQVGREVLAVRLQTWILP
jgi:hypothetical protein